MKPSARPIVLNAACVIAVAGMCGRLSADQTALGEVWRMAEFRFASSTDYAAGGADDLRFDVCFSNSMTGTTLSRPGFWDGSNAFLVRFAPTEAGRWDWRSSSADPSLDAHVGSLVARPYSGPHAIYRHGFLRTEPGKKYLLHADGTPFFYLGDTHWGMYREELDEPGPHAGTTGAASHFRHIVDCRVCQGFTVYQSEPIDASFRLTDGHVDAADIPGFRQADRYYRYLADVGLVHANAEFFFPNEMSDALAADAAALDRLSRYWVARFGAFPVLWTLAQEIDNDFYADQKRHKWNFANNPWVTVAKCIHRHDAYRHPLTGHQENTWETTVTGAGIATNQTTALWGGGRSVFLSDEVTRETGHAWWAAQWHPDLVGPVSLDIVRDYWNSPKPSVCYESRYCGLWTKDYGARAQGWIAFLCGFCGYGYGAVDQWLYRSDYEVDKPSHDGAETITVEDKARPWCESLEYPSARHMTHLKRFFTSFDWWNLKPVLKRMRAVDGQDVIGVHAVAGRRHVLYFYWKYRQDVLLDGLERETAYRLRWFDPQSGEWRGESVVTTDGQGCIQLPLRPDTQDWVLDLQ